MGDLEHCEHHEEQIKTVAEHGAKIMQLEKESSKIFDILAEHTGTLGDIKACIRKISFQLDTFERENAARILEASEVSKENNLRLEAVKARVDEIDEFSWFRKRVTWVRDNVFWTLAGILAISIGALMILHSASNKFMDVLLKCITK